MEIVYKEISEHIKRKNWHNLLLFNEFDLFILIENNDSFIRDICHSKNLKIIEHVLKHAIDPNVVNTEGKGFVHYACIINDINILLLLINQKLNLDMINSDRSRPIHYACSYASKEIVKLLIDKVNLEEINMFGRKPIHYACIRGHWQIVKLLIDKGVSITTKDYMKKTPLQYACTSGSLYTVQILIDGYISDKIISTPPKINPTLYSTTKSIKEYLLQKIEIKNTSRFHKIPFFYSDIVIQAEEQIEL